MPCSVRQRPKSLPSTNDNNNNDTHTNKTTTTNNNKSDDNNDNDDDNNNSNNQYRRRLAVMVGTMQRILTMSFSQTPVRPVRLLRVSISEGLIQADS